MLGLEVLKALIGNGDKGALDVARVLGRGLEVVHIVLICELLGRSEVDLARVNQVGLVANEEHRHRVEVVVAGEVAHPAIDVGEALHVGEVEHDEDGVGAAVVSSRDGAKPLLTSRVPDGKLHSPTIQVKLSDFLEGKILRRDDALG